VGTEACFLLALPYAAVLLVRHRAGRRERIAFVILSLLTAVVHVHDEP
jgi:hypothetical protein